MDSFVMLRFAELLASGTALTVLEKTLSERAKSGGTAIQTHADEIREAIAELTLAIRDKPSAGLK